MIVGRFLIAVPPPQCWPLQVRLAHKIHPLIRVARLLSRRNEMKRLGQLVTCSVLVAGVAGLSLAAASDPAAVTGFKEATERMHKSMPMAFTGNPDVDFAKSMLPHHQGAIDMAKVELAYGKDPQLRKMAADIIAAQEKEMSELTKWLAANGN